MKPLQRMAPTLCVDEAMDAIERMISTVANFPRKQLS